MTDLYGIFLLLSALLLLGQPPGHLASHPVVQSLLRARALHRLSLLVET